MATPAKVIHKPVASLLFFLTSNLPYPAYFSRHLLSWMSFLDRCAYTILDCEVCSEGLAQLLKTLENLGGYGGVGDRRLPAVGSLLSKSDIDGCQNDFRGKAITKHHASYDGLPIHRIGGPATPIMIAASIVEVRRERIGAQAIISIHIGGHKVHEVVGVNKVSETVKNHFALVDLNATENM